MRSLLEEKHLLESGVFFYLSIKWGLTYLKSGAYNKKKYCKYIQSDVLQKCSWEGVLEASVTTLKYPFLF